MLFVRVAVLIFRLTLISTADQTESNQSPYYDKARYFCLYFCFSDAWFFRPSHFKNKIVARLVRHKAITGRYVILKLYFKTEKQIIYHPKFRYLNTSKDIRAKTQFKPIKYWLMCYITRNLKKNLLCGLLSMCSRLKISKASRSCPH